MKVSSRILWVPKESRSADEYEDAYWPSKPIDSEARLFRFAIADGATETFFPSAWAKILVQAYCRGDLDDRKIAAAMPRLRREWIESIGVGGFPVYTEDEQTLDAYATLLGLTLYRSPFSGEYAWRALAMGDSCLFQVRDDRIIESFPIAHSDDFYHRPRLLPVGFYTLSKMV
jgi:hypothetical protein